MSAAQAPRYPLILVPGLFGFIRLLGYPYWFGIVAALRRLGARVFPVLVSPLHASEVRGEQLLEHIARVREATGADKVHLLGHSQGALTARYAAAMRPEWVASVTSLAGPNQGSELADFVERLTPAGSLRERLLVALASLLAWILGWLETGCRGPRLPADARAAQRSLTTAGVAEFNARFPQGLPPSADGEGPYEVNGVRYYSWSGILKPGITDSGGNRLDGPNLFCRLFARSFRREAGQCDGMVGRLSSHLGQVIGDDYPLDHFDIINQSFGLVGKGADPVGLFLAHARRLHEAGL